MKMDKQDVAQIMEILLAMQDEMKADGGATARMDAWLERTKAETEAIRAETEATLASTKAMRDKRIRANGYTCIEDIKFNREETMACQEAMEARLEEDKPASEDTTPEVAREQEVPGKDAEIVPFGKPRKKRRGRRRLAAERRQKRQNRDLDVRRRRRQQDLVAARRGTTRRAVVARRRMLLTKDTTRGYCGPRKGSVDAHRGTTRQAEVARHRRDATKKERDNARRAPGEQMTGKRRQVNPEGKTTMKDPDARWQLRLRDVRTAGRLCRGNQDVMGPKITKQTTRPSARSGRRGIGRCGGVDPLRSARSDGVSRAGYGEPRPLQELLPPLV
jgi:hypothetical protein